MSMIVGMVSAAAASGTPPFTQQFLDAASFGGQTPALAILYSGGTGALATATAGLQWQLGAVDAEGNQCAVAIACDSATSPTNAARSNRIDAAYEHITPAGVSDGRATATLIPDGVELTWSDQSVGESIRALLIGGAVEASVVSHESDNSLNVQTVTHGLSGPPEVIISIGVFAADTTTGGGEAMPGLGFWAIGSQTAVGVRYRDNVSTSAVSGRISTTEIAPAMGTNTNFTYTATISNVTDTTFDIQWTLNASVDTVHFICLRSTTEEPLDAIAGTFLTKTSTGTQTDITNLSVPPQIILTVPTRLADVDAGKSDDTGGGFGLGIACRRTGNGDNQYFGVFATGNDGEGAGTAWLNHQRHAGDHIVRLSLAGAVDVRARVSEWNDTNVVHGYQVANATASRVAYLAIGATGQSSAPAITSVTTVQVGETFTITGTGFSAAGNVVTLGGVAQTVSAESVTEITCAALTLGDLRYGNQTLVVTNATAGTGSATVAITPAANVAYTDLSGTLVGASNRPVLAPTDLAAGDQVEYSTAVNGTIADSLVATTGWVGMKPTDTGLDCSFDYRVHDGTEWGTSETITFATSSYGTPVVAGSRGQRSRRHRGPLNIGH